jgi:hypothetical protein
VIRARQLTRIDTVGALTIFAVDGVTLTTYHGEPMVPITQGWTVQYQHRVIGTA